MAEHHRNQPVTDKIFSRQDLEDAVKREKKRLAKWLKGYDNYSQYTGKTHNDLVRRLDIPNEDLYALYEEVGL